MLACLCACARACACMHVFVRALVHYTCSSARVRIIGVSACVRILMCVCRVCMYACVPVSACLRVCIAVPWNAIQTKDDNNARVCMTACVCACGRTHVHHHSHAVATLVGRFIKTRNRGSEVKTTMSTSTVFVPAC